MVRGVNMRSPFKKSKAAYVCVWCLVLLLIVFIWLRNGNSLFPSVISTLIAILLGFFTSRLLENIISNTETTKRLGYLHMEMDPKKFISSYKDVPENTKGDKEKMISYAYLSSGYEAAGDFDRALETLEKGNINGSDSLDTLYLSQKCRCLIEKGILDEAEDVLKELEKRIDSITGNQSLKDNQRQVQYVLSEMLRAKKGETVDMEYLEGRLKATQYKIGRLEIYYTMAMYYRNKGNKKKEAETLSIITKEGGKTWFKTWAEGRRAEN